ncbi:unnamed protein product [Callosobruchus maculatus]|uniref:Uncharacterized protein n=1 Tax=Callosobruchus maculatus TaxID=64391 RepID=A0A653D0Q1_CALMS|nr:unnamed protein product [Callosobruchus maculatus]
MTRNSLTMAEVSGSNSDKASTEPLNKELNSSTDSLEEKNPDIIPQNNAEDEYQDEERAFERLNNITIRSYSRIQSPNNQLKNENYITKVLQSLLDVSSSRTPTITSTLPRTVTATRF